MLTKEQKRDIMERAFGTYERNELIRFLYETGFKQAFLTRAFMMKKQRVWQIIRGK